MTAEICVFDASAGAKWLRDEAGAEEARELLRKHAEGTLIIAVDTLFLYELLAVAARHGEDIRSLWEDLDGLDLAVVPPGEELVAAACDVRAQTGCSLYDAFSAGLAHLLHAPLYSADARAHGSLPYARLLGL